MDIISTPTEQATKTPEKLINTGNATARKMIYLAALFFGGITVMTLLPESQQHFVSPAVMMGILWVLFR